MKKNQKSWPKKYRSDESTLFFHFQLSLSSFFDNIKGQKIDFGISLIIHRKGELGSRDSKYRNNAKLSFPFKPVLKRLYHNKSRELKSAHILLTGSNRDHIFLQVHYRQSLLRSSRNGGCALNTLHFWY